VQRGGAEVVPDHLAGHLADRGHATEQPHLVHVGDGGPDAEVGLDVDEGHQRRDEPDDQEVEKAHIASGSGESV
jgi:hypothetical protein